MIPIFTGQPSRNATELHFAASHLKPPVAHEDGSEEQPLALIAYTRPLANSAARSRRRTPSEAVVRSPALIAPSLPCSVEVLLVGADDDRRRLVRAVEVGHRRACRRSCPGLRFCRGSPGTLELNVGSLLVGSTEATFSGSSTSTGKPLTGFAVGVPGVHVAVLAGGDDVEARALFGFEVGQHRRGREAALGALAHARALGLPRGVAGQRRARVVGVGGLVEDQLALRVPRVHVAFAGRRRRCPFRRRR